MTREEVLNLMRSGQLGNQPAPGSPPSGLRGGQPPRGPVPAASPRERAGPGTGLMPGMPGRRSHTTAPGAPPYVGPAPPAIPPTFDEEEERKAKGRVGSSADRAGRRARRNERAVERRVTSPLPAATLLTEEEDVRRVRATAKRGQKGGGQRFALAPTRKNHAEIEPPITVRNLSEAIGIKANDLFRKLMAHGPDGHHQRHVSTTIWRIMLVHGVRHRARRSFTRAPRRMNCSTRSPPGTHRKTSNPGPRSSRSWATSTTARRRSWTASASPMSCESESGGITQHIGAYQVESNGKPITFVDTPGHEAFTAMRARGANVTDIVVLVVAADDGVMPQTVEAIAHAKAAEVPIVVALNKIDLPNVDTPANINKIYGELSQQGLHPVEWGGDTEVVKTSAATGQGIPDLLATLETIADLHELKADPSRPGDRNLPGGLALRGPRRASPPCWSRTGPCRVGDVIVCGDGFGRVRALFNDKGRSIDAGRPVHPGRDLRARCRSHRRRELRRRSTTSPAPARSPRPAGSAPAMPPTPTARPSRWKTSTARWPSRRSRAST